MSGEINPPNLASGHAERRGPVFLVVEHNGRKVAIGRNPNYQETIMSIRDNVHELKETPSDQIIILAHLEEVDDHVQITKEVWGNLLPRFITVRVELRNTLPHPVASSSTSDQAGDKSSSVTRTRVRLAGFSPPSGHAQTGTGTGYLPAWGRPKEQGASSEDPTRRETGGNEQETAPKVVRHREERNRRLISGPYGGVVSNSSSLRQYTPAGGGGSRVAAKDAATASSVPSDPSSEPQVDH